MKSCIGFIERDHSFFEIATINWFGSVEGEQ